LEITNAKQNTTANSYSVKTYMLEKQDLNVECNQPNKISFKKNKIKKKKKEFNPSKGFIPSLRLSTRFIE